MLEPLPRLVLAAASSGACALRTLDGKEDDMAGLVPGVAAMRDRLAAIGYAEAAEGFVASCERSRLARRGTA